MAQNLAPMMIEEARTTQPSNKPKKPEDKPKTVENAKTETKPEEKPKTTTTQALVQKPTKPTIPASQSEQLVPSNPKVINKPRSVPDVRIHDVEDDDEDDEEVEEDNHFCDDEAEEDNRPEDIIDNDCLSYVQEKPVPVSLCVKCFFRTKRAGDPYLCWRCRQSEKDKAARLVLRKKKDAEYFYKMQREQEEIQINVMKHTKKMLIAQQSYSNEKAQSIKQLEDDIFHLLPARMKLLSC